MKKQNSGDYIGKVTITLCWCCFFPIRVFLRVTGSQTSDLSPLVVCCPLLESTTNGSSSRTTLVYSGVIRDRLAKQPPTFQDITLLWENSDIRRVQEASVGQTAKGGFAVL